MSGSLPGWAIALIVVGGVIFVLAHVPCVYYIYKYLKARYGEKFLVSMLSRKVQQNYVREYKIDQVAKTTDNFNANNVLGEGAYGVVYKGESPDGEQWAVKRWKKISDLASVEFENEILMISKLNHRNLVKLLGYCFIDTKEQILIYEFVPNGTLRQHINYSLQGFASKVLTFNQRLDIALKCAQGLQYLHNFAKPAIIHRDIKSVNILLDEEMEPKVADFGLFKEHDEKDIESGQITHLAGTPGYMDPEYHTKLKVTTKSDVYSFGVVMLELITAKMPILSERRDEDGYKTNLPNWAMPYVVEGQVERIVDPALRSYPPKAMAMFATVAATCVMKESQHRPEMETVVARLNQVKEHLMQSKEKEQEAADLDKIDEEQALAPKEVEEPITAIEMQFHQLQESMSKVVTAQPGWDRMSREALSETDNSSDRYKSGSNMTSSSGLMMSTQDMPLSMPSAR